MKIKTDSGVLSFGENDDLRISRISATGNLDISGNSNLILDVSGVGIGTATPTYSFDVSGTLNATTLTIGGISPKGYVISGHWEADDITDAYTDMKLVGISYVDDKIEWAVGYEPDITWYGFTMTQDDEEDPRGYKIKAFVNGSAQTIDTTGDPVGGIEFDFIGPDEHDSVYIDFDQTFNTTKGQKISIKIKSTSGDQTEEANIMLFGYYELFN